MHSNRIKVLCTASNPHGTAETQCEMKRVKRGSPSNSLQDDQQSPRFIVPLKHISTCSKEVKLKCIIDGEPTPKVTWYANGEELTHGSVSVSAPDWF